MFQRIVCAIVFLGSIGFALSGRAQAQGSVTAQTDSTCSYSFSTGANNTSLQYCVSKNGNVQYITTPAGHGNSGTDEGYGVCDTGTGSSYEEWGSRFGNTLNWGPANVTTHTATVVKTVRTTIDNFFTLTQTITMVPSNSSIKVAMALKNNTTVARNVNLVRYIYATPDDNLIANYDGTQNGAFAWRSIGTGNSPFGLMMQTVGTSPFAGYNGFAQNSADPPYSCDYVRHWTGGLAQNINGSLVTVWVGTLPARGSKTFTISYKGM